MLIEWTDLNHTITRSFGQDVTGLSYKHERPDKITIKYEELSVNWMLAEQLRYLKALLLATKDRKIEITY